MLDEDVMELDDEEVLEIEEEVDGVSSRTVAILCTAERNPGRLGAVDCAAAAALLEAAKARPTSTDLCQCILARIISIAILD